MSIDCSSSICKEKVYNKGFINVIIKVGRVHKNEFNPPLLLNNLKNVAPFYDATLAIFNNPLIHLSKCHQRNLIARLDVISS